MSELEHAFFSNSGEMDVSCLAIIFEAFLYFQIKCACYNYKCMSCDPQLSNKDIFKKI